MKIAILDRQAGEINYGLAQLGLEAQLSGHDAINIALHKGDGLRSESEVTHDIEAFHPHLIIAMNGTYIPFANVIQEYQVAELGVSGYPTRFVVLWADDPVMRIDGEPNGAEVVKNAYLAEHWVWDGYWKEKMKEKYSIIAKDFDLVASPITFFPSTCRDHKDKIVFYGHLQSPYYINHVLDEMPSVFREVMRLIVDSRQITSWDKAIENAESRLLIGDNHLWRAEIKETNKLSLFRQIVWAYMKNCIRIDMLMACLQRGPLLVCGETGGKLNHCSEHELRSLLGQWGKHLSFIDTTGATLENLSRIYHLGKIQVQAIDPQSVYGGVPYRNFEAAASGRCLVSTPNPRMQEIFGRGVSVDIDELLNDPAQEKERGMLARQTMENGYTWRHLLENILKENP